MIVIVLEKMEYFPDKHHVHTPMVDDPVGNYAKAEGYSSTSSNSSEAYGFTGYY